MTTATEPATMAVFKGLPAFKRDPARRL